MSHVVLASVGTHGDVLPYIALGIALRGRGHRVTVAANEQFGPLAGEHGLEFVDLVSNAETRELLENPDLWHPIKSGLVGARWGRRGLRRQYDQLAGAARGDDVVLAASPAVVAARLLQEKYGLPLASIYHIPWMIASCTAPPIMTGGWTLPRWSPRPVGRLYWRFVEFNGWLLIGRQLNALRTTLGLRPIRRIFHWWTSPELAIGLFPDWYAPPQADWPAQLRVAGFPRFDGEGDERLAPAVLEFCRAGDPPVVFTFGTGMMHADKLFRAAVEACGRIGARGLLLARHGCAALENLPPAVRHFEYASLQAVLPHCRAIVHHGGIGTTARSLAAGTPQLIIPHAWDQLDNGTRVERLGAGRTLRRRHATPDRIAQSLAALTTGETAARSRDVARLCNGPDPLQLAAQWIEELAAAHASERRSSGAS